MRKSKVFKLIMSILIVLLFIPQFTVKEAYADTKGTIALKIVVLSANELKLKAKDKAALTANMLPADASNKEISWSSSNSKIAKVDKSGNVTAVSKGIAVVTAAAKDNGAADYCIVYVDNASLKKVKSIALTSKKMEMNSGASASLQYTITPQNTDVNIVRWYSTDESIASVNNSGKVTANSPGTAQIIVETLDGNLTDACSVKVKPVIKKVTLNKSEIDLKQGTAYSKLKAELSPAISNEPINWTSNQPLVANVDKSGKIYAYSEGTAVITASAAADSTKSASCTVKVTAKKSDITDITFSKKKATITAGDTYKIDYSVNSKGTNSVIVWKSSDEQAATVDINGTVTGIASGTAAITAATTDGKKLASCQITVKKNSKVQLTGISLDSTSSNIKAGDSFTLKPSAEPSNAKLSNLVWGSSDETVAEVDNNGNVTALTAGTSIISVSTENGEISAYCIVRVMPQAVTIELNQSNISMVTGGNPVVLTATVKPDNLEDKKVIWTSSDSTVASVDDTGKVTAVTKGTATITAAYAKDNTVKARCTINVAQGIDIPVAGIELNTNKLDLNVGHSIVLTGNVVPANATNKNIIWTSSDSSVVTVDANGLVKAVAKGSTFVTAQTQDGKFISNCLVNVTDIPRYNVTGITLDMSLTYLKVGTSTKISAIITPTYATDKKVNWSSGDTSVANVDGSGNVTAVGPGVAVIFAKTDDGNFMAYCTVNVIK